MFEPSFLLGLVASMSAVVATMVGLLTVYQANRRARYDAELHRAQMDMMRHSMERDMYSKSRELESTEARWRDLNHLLLSRLERQPNSVSEVAPSNDLLGTFGINASDTKLDPRLVFVLMPFHSDFDSTFRVISESCSQIGLRAVRGDEEQIDGDLMPHILRLMTSAIVIVAVIDGRNANVFYELGIAHAIGKVTILLTRSLETTPIDLRSRKLVVWENAEDLRDRLKTELARTLVGRSDAIAGNQR